MRETDTDSVNGEADISAPHMRAASSHRARIAARLDSIPQELKPAQEPFRPSAVLFPIVERETLTVLFTRRTDHLSSHAGQVCFPGGGLHAEDESLTAAALRELEEEIGIAPGWVAVAGYLDPFRTLNSGFTILPVVGFLRPDFILTVNEHEVAEVFEAPLDYLLDPKNHRRGMFERGGAMREFYAIDAGGHTIWGATAAMIVNLAERLKA